MQTTISDAQWERFEAEGYLPLGTVLPPDELSALQERIDAIMLGTADVPYDRIMMQLDSADGAYGSAGPQTRGHKGATLAYRKIQDLELDPLFREFLERPLFRHLCDRAHGAGTSMACFRAMFMNKPAQRGTVLPWHQDRWSYLDRDPLLTVWTALDPATAANGCVQIVPGSHREGLINPDHPSGFLTQEQAAGLDARGIDLEVPAGEAVLLHNWTLHRSGVNHSDIARRAFSVCYLEAATRAANNTTFTRLWDG